MLQFLRPYLEIVLNIGTLNYVEKMDSVIQF